MTTTGMLSSIVETHTDGIKDWPDPLERAQAIKFPEKTLVRIKSRGTPTSSHCIRVRRGGLPLACLIPSVHAYTIRTRRVSYVY